MPLRVVVDRPCAQGGDAFEVRAGGRFCLSCQEMQHDLTQATRAEAAALFARHGGRLCGTFRTSPTGEVLFRPDPPSRVGAARGAALALALAACGSPEAPTGAPPETTSAPPSSAPPSTIAAPPPSTDTPPPPSTVAAPPPTTTAEDAALHATDASSDPSDHHGHSHLHEPALVGMGPGIAMHVSGGAGVAQLDPTTPLPVVRGNYGAMTFEGPGTVDHAMVARMVASRQAAIRAAYEQALDRDPTLAGHLSATVSVDEDGHVTDVTIDENETNDAQLAGRTQAVLRSIRIAPPPEGGTVRFTVRYELALPPV